MRFEVSKRRWVDATIAVTASLAVKFLFFWLQHDPAPPESVIRVDPCTLTLLLLESGSLPDRATFLISISAEPTRIQFSSKARILDWQPLNAVASQSVDPTTLREVAVEVSSTHEDSGFFQATLVAELDPRFACPTAGSHDSLPFSTPIHAGQLVMELDYSEGRQQKSIAFSVEVKFLRTSPPTGQSAMHPQLFLSCGAVHCSSATGSIDVLCSARDDLTPSGRLEYRARLDESEWSAWLDKRVFNFDALDQGVHRIGVQVRDDNSNISEAACEFIVKCTSAEETGRKSEVLSQPSSSPASNVPPLPVPESTAIPVTGPESTTIPVTSPESTAIPFTGPDSTAIPFTGPESTTTPFTVPELTIPAYEEPE